MTENDELFFSSKPRSFKMDRRSQTACKLKAAVLNKLVEFLDNYTDDDLAEYIVVLVCNGKHQNQARDDLDAFLGNSSGKFVSWLWNHLSNDFCVPESLALVQPLVNKDDSTACTSDVALVNKGAKEAGFRTHHMLPNGDQRFPAMNSNQKPPAATVVLEASQSPVPSNSAPLTDVISKESQQETPRILSSVAMVDELRKTSKIHHFSGKCFSQISCHSDQAELIIEDCYQKADKMPVLQNSTAFQHSLFSSTRKSTSRNELSITTGKPQGPSSILNVGRSSTQVMDSPNHRRRRVSVWDRLGKPCNVDADTDDTQNFMTDAIQRNHMCHAENWLEEHMAINEEYGVNQKGGDATGRTEVNEHRARTILVNRQDSIRAARSFKRRRQFQVKAVDDSVQLPTSNVTVSQAQETGKKIQNCAPTSSDAFPGSIELLPVTRNAGNSRESIKLSSNLSRDLKASKATSNAQLSQSSPLTTKLGSNSMKINSDHLPVKKDITDFDSQLYKVKKTILELNTKQAELSKDRKEVSLGSTQCQGVQNQYAEDAEGRTIFVANVHFAAPKEALSLHFSKFGPVVNVTLLMDGMTGMPRGCAYIVYRYKDSAEKALSLNGTSFFSRTLKVMWKVEMPEDKLGPGQCGVKSLKYSWSQGTGSFHFHKRYNSPHLKWKREHQENEENLRRSEASSKQG